MNTLGSILLDAKLDSSLQAQLYAQLKDTIRHGSLRAGERLPSSRELALQLHVSRNTVVAAYEMLVSEGYLEAEARAGVFVGRAARAFRRSPSPAAPSATRIASGELTARLEAPRPFRPAQPDVRLFPLQIWNRHRARVLRRGTNILHYQSVYSSGLDTLRKNLAAYLSDSRGVRCDWREIAITSGSQQALFLLGHLLVRPGSRVFMEDPGYPGARLAWKQVGAKIASVPVDEEGARLPHADGRPVSLIYVTPSRQFPLGTTMSLGRRLDLLRAAVALRTWVVEDDYDSEFRYASPPLPSLQSLDGNRRVIYVGSFSKILFPTLRLGYVVLPPALVDSFARLKHVADDHGPLLDQATLAAFMESGAFYTHLRRCRRTYAERQHFFLEEARRLGLPLRFPVTDGGMNLAGFLAEDADDCGWNEAFRAQGLDIAPLSRYAVQEARPGLLFGFTAFDQTAIRNGLVRLARVFDGR